MNVTDTERGNALDSVALTGRAPDLATEAHDAFCKAHNLARRGDALNARTEAAKIERIAARLDGKEGLAAETFLAAAMACIHAEESRQEAERLVSQAVFLQIDRVREARDAA